MSFIAPNGHIAKLYSLEYLMARGGGVVVVAAGETMIRVAPNLSSSEILYSKIHHSVRSNLVFNFIICEF